MSFSLSHLILVDGSSIVASVSITEAPYEVYIERVLAASHFLKLP